jgi:hypothetical protein
MVPLEVLAVPVTITVLDTGAICRLGALAVLLLLLLVVLVPAELEEVPPPLLQLGLPKTINNITKAIAAVQRRSQRTRLVRCNRTTRFDRRGIPQSRMKASAKAPATHPPKLLNVRKLVLAAGTVTVSVASTTELTAIEAGLTEHVAPLRVGETLQERLTTSSKPFIGLRKSAAEPEPPGAAEKEKTAVYIWKPDAWLDAGTNDFHSVTRFETSIDPRPVT